MLDDLHTPECLALSFVFPCRSRTRRRPHLQCSSKVNEKEEKDKRKPNDKTNQPNIKKKNQKETPPKTHGLNMLCSASAIPLPVPAPHERRLIKERFSMRE